MQDVFSGSSDPQVKKDAADWTAGSAFTVPRIMPIVFSFDARTLGTDFDLPVFLTQGRDDNVGFRDEAKKYMDDVHALQKGLVAIDGGHFACFTNAGAFVSALRADTKSYEEPCMPS